MEPGPEDQPPTPISTKVLMSTISAPSNRNLNVYAGGSYWFNGIVGAAFLLDDSRLKTQAQGFLDYVIENQAADGWLGPEPRTLWGRSVMHKILSSFL